MTNGFSSSAFGKGCSPYMWKHTTSLWIQYVLVSPVNFNLYGNLLSLVLILWGIFLQALCFPPSSKSLVDLNNIRSGNSEQIATANFLFVEFICLVKASIKSVVSCCWTVIFVQLLMRYIYPPVLRIVLT